MPAPNYRAFIAQLLAGSLKPLRLHDATGAVEEWPLHVIAIGGIYETTSTVDPGLAQAQGGLGYGSWQRFGNGRVLVAVDETDTDFDAAEKTRGAKTATPAGSVTAPVFTGSAVTSTSVSAGTPAGTVGAHATAADSNTTGGTAKVTGGTHTFTGTALPGHAHSVTAAGTNSAPTFTGAALSVVQPSIAVYRWRRVG